MANPRDQNWRTSRECDWSHIVSNIHCRYTNDSEYKDSHLCRYDTAILAMANMQAEAADQLQTALNKITIWTKKWHIKLNEAKSVQVTYTLRCKDPHYCMLLNVAPIPQVESAKYLGMHSDSQLNWKLHVEQKVRQISKKLQQMYWTMWRNAKTSLRTKVLIYKTIIKPIWMYSI